MHDEKKEEHKDGKERERRVNKKEREMKIEGQGI
jgi:hypothetical protein